MTCRAEEGSESFLQLMISDSATAAATLTDLQCNTNYTITVMATAGEYRTEEAVFLQLQGESQTHNYKFKNDTY